MRKITSLDLGSKEKLPVLVVREEWAPLIVAFVGSGKKVKSYKAVSNGKTFYLARCKGV